MSISSSLRALVLERDKYRCMFCGATAEQTQLQVDHIIPRDEGGTDSLDNLATLCQRCNRGKSNKYFGNYRQMIIARTLPSPQQRSNVYPTLNYQLEALRQLIAHLRQHKEIPFSNFVRAIQTSSLRTDINPMYEPLTFATVKEGIDELIVAGELVIDNQDVTFPLNTASLTQEILPRHIQHMYSYAEAQGWEYVTFTSQHNFGFALTGRQLGPADVETCPQLPEVTIVLQQVSITSSAIIKGKSGSGKTITAFQAAYTLHKQGWEVLRLIEPHRSVYELIDGIRALPRRTVLILDNAQSLDQSLIRQLLDRATDSLTVIVISTEDVVHPLDAVSIVGSRAVATLAKAAQNRQKEILPIIQKLDPSVGEGFLDVSLEHRIKDAERCETPWQFTFVLTGGERRANDILARIREANRADLLLATIAAGQIVTLDEGVSRVWLEQAMPLLGRDQIWLKESLEILQEQRVVFGDRYYRCSHLRFSVYVLHVICAQTSDSEWNNIITMLGGIIGWEATLLRGISWLLNELRFYDAFAYERKYNTIITSSNWQQILTRCWKAGNEQERRDAAFVLEALIDWHPDHIQAISEKTALLADWIQNTEGIAGFGLGTLLNDLGQGYRNVRHIAEAICDLIDPGVIATKLSQVKWSDVAGWSYLIGRMRWASSQQWCEQFDQVADFSFLETMVDTMSISDTYAFSELLKNVSGFHPENFLGIYEKAIPTLVDAMHSNTIEAYRELSDSIWVVLGYAPMFLRRRAPLASQRRVAKKFVSALQPQIIAKAIAYAPQRDWSTCADILSFIKEAAPVQATKIGSAINFAQLDETTQELWHNCPHELLQLILSLAILPDHNPASSWIVRHRNELGDMNVVLAYVVPQIAVEKLRAGFKLPLTLFWAELSLLALQAVAAIDNSLAVSTIEQNRDLITYELARLQPHNSKGVAVLLAYLHSLSSSAFTAIINEIEPEEAKKNWSLCLQGDTESKNVIARLFALSEFAEGPIIETINQLKIKYPKASSYWSVHVKQLAKMD